MKKTLLIVYVSLLLFPLFRAQAFNIFGKDHRTAPHSTAFPFNMIGKLISPMQRLTESGCTGSLVGPDLVLTNFHCVANVAADAPGEITFKVGYDQGKFIDSAKVESISAPYRQTETGVEYLYKTDFAILKLDRRLGDKYGWFRLAPSSASYEGAQVSLAGYSGDIENGETLSLAKECHLYGQRQGMILHDCDYTKGASGSPIYIIKEGVAIIVALNQGEFTGHSKDTGKSLTLPFYDENYSNTAVMTEYIAPNLK